MHPAASVIFFTSLSGLGYGLMIALSLSALFQLDILPATSLALGLFIGMAIAAFGLSLSLFHLGHPERAWRALSQWRSSWLSREGVFALLSFLPNSILIILLVNNQQVSNAGMFQWPFVSNVGLALATIFATAMIYRSLRSITAWHTNWVPLGYLTLAFASGFLFASAYGWSVDGDAGSLPKWAFLSLVAAALVKLAYWRYLNVTAELSTAASAFGLTEVRTVKQFVAPHTEDNYLLKEMGYQIGRKHAHKLRKICLTVGFIAALLLLLPALGGGGQSALVCLWFSVVAAMIGIVLERWLFFAEAKHSVGIYYGR